MNPKVVVITGGAGFIGCSLAKFLISQHHEVHLFDNLSNSVEWNLPPEANFHRIDVSDEKMLFNYAHRIRPNVVYHFAAQSSGEASFLDPVSDIASNYTATLLMLKWAELNNVDRFIYASSMSVYGNIKSQIPISETAVCDPVSYYGCNKLASEMLIRIFCSRSKIKFTTLRFFNVYGPGQNMNNMAQGMASIYLSYLMRDQPIHVKGGMDRYRDFIYIDDLVQLLAEIESNALSYNQTFNVGTGKRTTVKTLIQAMLSAYGNRDFDSWVRTEGNTPGDIQGIIANVDKLNSITSWRANTTVERGIGAMKVWIDATRHKWVNQ